MHYVYRIAPSFLVVRVFWFAITVEAELAHVADRVTVPVVTLFDYITRIVWVAGVFDSVSYDMSDCNLPSVWFTSGLKVDS
jgi:hypothetical protein